MNWRAESRRRKRKEERGKRKRTNRTSAKPLQAFGAVRTCTGCVCLLGVSARCADSLFSPAESRRRRSKLGPGRRKDRGGEREKGGLAVRSQGDRQSRGRTAIIPTQERRSERGAARKREHILQNISTLEGRINYIIARQEKDRGEEEKEEREGGEDFAKTPKEAQRGKRKLPVSNTVWESRAGTLFSEDLNSLRRSSPPFYQLRGISSRHLSAAAGSIDRKGIWIRPRQKQARRQTGPGEAQKSEPKKRRRLLI